MTKPFSVWKYYQCNRRKVNVVFTLTFLSVFLQCAASIYTASTLKLTNGTLLKVFNTCAFFTTVNATSDSQAKIRQELNHYPAVAKVIPCKFKQLSFTIPVCTGLLFEMEPAEIQPLMQAFKLKLLQGRMPTPGTHEIVLHWRIAANKGLKIGDHFGNKEFPDNDLTGKYRLVGIIGGEPVIGFAPLKTGGRDEREPQKQLQSSLVVPQPGQLEQLKQYLERIAQKNHGVYLPAAAEGMLLRFQNQVWLMVNFLQVIIITSSTICTGFLFYLYFYQRRAELALLEALGHTRQMIIGRSFREIFTINLLGFGSAMAFCLLGFWSLNRFILQNQGLSLTLWNPGYFFHLLSTPLFTSCCALIPVWRMLKKVDPVALIEGQATSPQQLKIDRPLSSWRYLFSNWRQSGVVITVTFLGIILHCTLLVYTTSIITTLQRTDQELWKVLTSIEYLEVSKQNRANLGLLRQSLDKHPSVARVLTFTAISTSMNGVGSPLIFLVESNETLPLMRLLGLKLIQGRLPSLGSREIIMHWELAANKGLKIGDRLCDQGSKREQLLGEYRLVGLVDGKAILSFADPEDYIQHYGLSKGDLGLLVIPKKGQLAKVKQYLTALRQKDKNLYDSTAREKNSYTTSVLFIVALNTVYFALTTIITLCVSFLFYLYFYKRRPEFGMLEALGHTRKMIAGRLFREIAGISLFAFVLGLSVALLGGWVFNRMLLIQYGIPLVLWDPSYPGKLLPIPLLITLCSIIPVWRMLVKVDPIAMLESAE